MSVVIVIGCVHPMTVHKITVKQRFKIKYRPQDCVANESVNLIYPPV